MNDTALKEWLIADFNAPESMLWNGDHRVNDFKERFAVTDDQLYRVLMEIYSESDAEWARLTPNSPEWYRNQRAVEGVIGWLPKCGDKPIKEFLLDFAADKKNDSNVRSEAVLSFLRVANAQEAKDVLLRFLVKEERMSPLQRMSLYAFAKMTYDTASQEKKASILNALILSAVREEGKIEFMKVDKILAGRSADYRHSVERLALLERHGKEAPTNNLYTDRDLKTALAESRSFTQHTSVSTNLLLIELRDFNLSQLGPLTNSVAGDVPSGDDVESIIEGLSSRGISRYSLFSIVTLVILGFGMWLFSRK